jgi:hypothetical protein
MIHHAKVDTWVTALFGGLRLLEIAIGVAAVAAALTVGRPSLTESLVIAAICAAVGVLMGLLLWSCYSTRYEITSSDLVVRFGPFHKTLPLDAIADVFPTRNPLSAPAPSLDRLQINYRRTNGWRKFVLISPRDKMAFVRDLASAAPWLESAAEDPMRLTAQPPRTESQSTDRGAIPIRPVN